MKNTSFFKESQGYLSAGYVYLILLGILNETFYYNQIGVDILKYASIMDILISPIARLTSSMVRIIIFLIVVFTVFRIPLYLAKKKDKQWFKKIFTFEPKNPSVSEIKRQLLQTALFMLSIGLLGFYVGTGVGAGSRVSKKIEEKKIIYEDTLTFINDTKETVKIVGKNSSYIFYLSKGSDIVKIAPINGNIKYIEENK
ncbi:hypothetical protein ACFSTE_00110 [Aquimarina hainanensis]|uniref:Uncharacterized protein n=1 Tax=Aquimarina hainanensis TaxID=1578017 RepID=A0ABW5N2B9_9FLAO|nr:hypothetical protein [Aquimarina sp. TRL1]QKX04664.1 hypothetical protein HN014_06970 [Aquimarina sp. TRL1]